MMFAVQCNIDDVHIIYLEYLLLSHTNKLDNFVRNLVKRLSVHITFSATQVGRFFFREFAVSASSTPKKAPKEAFCVT